MLFFFLSVCSAAKLFKFCNLRCIWKGKRLAKGSAWQVICNLYISEERTSYLNHNLHLFLQTYILGPNIYLWKPTSHATVLLATFQRRNRRRHSRDDNDSDIYSTFCFTLVWNEWPPLIFQWETLSLAFWASNTICTQLC